VNTTLTLAIDISYKNILHRPNPQSVFNLHTYQIMNFNIMLNNILLDNHFLSFKMYHNLEIKIYQNLRYKHISILDSTSGTIYYYIINYFFFVR